MVNHYIRYCSCTFRFQFGDKLTQLRFATPRTAQIAVLLGVVTRTGSSGYRRKPYKVKILAEFIDLVEQRAPTGIAVRAT